MKELKDIIIGLLIDPAIDPVFRENVINKLDKASEEELTALAKALQDKILKMRLLDDTLKELSAQIKIEAINRGNISKLHPLYSWQLPKVTKLLANNCLNYIRSGVNLRDEYELYVLSQRDMGGDLPVVDIVTYSVEEIREAFLLGIRKCNQQFNDQKSALTVARFVQMYDQQFNPTKTRSAFDRTQFIGKLQLNNQESTLAIKLLDVYDYITYTDALVMTPEMQALINQIKSMPLEDDVEMDFNKNVDKPDVLNLPVVVNSEKNFEKINNKNVIRDEKIVLTNSSRQSRLFFADVEAEVKKLVVNKISDDMLTNALHQGVLKGESVAVLSLLKLLAQNNKLNLLLADKRLTQMLAAVYRRQGNKQAEQLLATDPANISHLAAMLKYVLIDRLKISNNDAAWIAADLIGLEHEAGGQTPHMAYFDEATQKFAWV